MKALLICPEYPPLTYWSFSRALPYIERRAAMPPLGLITVAAMLPEHWELRLIDMNISPLRDDDLLWADVVMTSTMVVQAPSHTEVVVRCKRLGVPVVAGGPFPSGSPERLEGVDHLFVGEAEGALTQLVEDLERGEAKPIYRAGGKPDVDESPIPRFDLLELDAYASMAVQHSRGCPFSCEFCDIWTLYGRKMRIKSAERLAAELDVLYEGGWRGSVFFVDDNFIGNPRRAKESLQALERWQKNHDFPFQFFTEASVNLGTDDELMAHMRDAGFNFVFLGIESPSDESLAGANKPLNVKLDLLQVVRRIQAHGIEVSSGFIVGFDEDTHEIFDRQIEFIEEAAIPMAMVGILTAVEGTVLYERLQDEGRLLSETYGNNTHSFEPNFVTRMPADLLVAGYKRVMSTLYDPTLANYFARCRRLFERLGPNRCFTRRIVGYELRALLRSLTTIPTRRFGRQYLRFLLWSLFRYPARFPEAVSLAIKGFHLEAITREALTCDRIRDESMRLGGRFGEWLAQLGGGSGRVPQLLAERARALRQLRRKIRRLAPETRPVGVMAYRGLVKRVDALIEEHVPTAAHAFVAGSTRLGRLRDACRRDAELIRARYLEACEEAKRGVADLNRELQALYKERRDILKRARRRVRQLPREYRLLGGIELQALRRSLDELLPEVALVPVQA